MLRTAFKEWAVICQALAEGRQGIILRKGGIAETTGEFTVEHRRFWLFPTYVHQQRDGIQPEAVAGLDRVEAERPPEQIVRLSHFVEVAAVYQLHDLPSALVLNGLHLWSEETVRNRFAYRHPGLFALAVRVFRAAAPLELPITDEYAGCKSWVDLGVELPTEGATPVLAVPVFEELLDTLDLLLNPTALA